MPHLTCLTMRRGYEDIVLFWKCLHDMYDINVHDFVKFTCDSKLITRSSNESEFLIIPSLCRTDCFWRSFLIGLFKFGTLCLRVSAAYLYITLFVVECKQCFL